MQPRYCRFSSLIWKSFGGESFGSVIANAIELSREECTNAELGMYWYVLWSQPAKRRERDLAVVPVVGRFVSCEREKKKNRNYSFLLDIF